MSPPGVYVQRGDLTEGFLHYKFGVLIFAGDNTTWRAYFQNFMVHTYKNTHRQTKTNKTKIKEKNNNLGGFLSETKLSFIELRKSNGTVTCKLQ